MGVPDGLAARVAGEIGIFQHLQTADCRAHRSAGVKFFTSTLSISLDEEISQWV